MGRQRLYVLRKNPLKASALNEDKPKASDEFSTATPEAERERVLPKNIQILLPPAGSAPLPLNRWFCLVLYQFSQNKVNYCVEFQKKTHKTNAFL